jgi:L-alanine-DL-glutamate epimerase-like enolase superfamily enzyme
MRITDLDFYVVEVPQADQLPPVRSLLVRLGTDDGLEGWGEGNVAWRPSELSPRRDFLLPVLSGRSVFDIEELAAVEALANPSLRAAVEMACWDMIGKITGQPLCRLWGGEYRQRIPIAARLAGNWPVRMARELSTHGYLTLVLGRSDEDYEERFFVRQIREAVGDSIELRVDAGAGLFADCTRDFCREIESQRIQCLIDPVFACGVRPVAALASQTNVPLGVWRAVRSPTDLLEVVRLQAASHAVIDSEQLGGLSAARACVQIGAAAGLTLMLGSRSALGLATAAMLHLAAATPSLTAAHETSYHQLSGDVLAEPLTVSEGMMAVPECPGLGVEIDRGKIERYAVG